MDGIPLHILGKGIDPSNPDPPPSFGTIVPVDIPGPMTTEAENVMEAKVIQTLVEGGTVGDARANAGLKSNAEVYGVISRVSHRKEYMDALKKHGVSFDLIASKLRQLIAESDAPMVQLAAVNTVIKSLGVDRFEREDQEQTTSSWEDAVMKAARDSGNAVIAEYEVDVPEPPDEEKRRLAKEAEESKALYGGAS